MKKLLPAGALAALLACSACGNGGPPPENMVRIEPGKFKMGYDNGRPNEKPARDVEVDKSFLIGKYEVTNEDYTKFILATKRAAPPNWPNGKYNEGEGKFPVTHVSYDDARMYAEWKVMRLPTEVEWEYAARGKDGRLFPWGGEWATGKANNFEAGKNGPVAVGSFPDGKSPFGTYDQAGNVWEWTGTLGPSGANQYIIKGGSYAPLEDRPRGSLRQAVAKDQAKETIGFRVAMDE